MARRSRARSAGRASHSWQRIPVDSAGGGRAGGPAYAPMRPSDPGTHVERDCGVKASVLRGRRFQRTGVHYFVSQWMVTVLPPSSTVVFSPAAALAPEHPGPLGHEYVSHLKGSSTVWRSKWSVVLVKEMEPDEG